MRVKVVCAFPGLGKTTIGNKYANVCDLQSSSYRYDYSNVKKEDYEKMKALSSRIPNPRWPSNYLNDILKSMKKYDLVLLPANIDIRNLLLKNNIKFILVLPSLDSYDILIKRYKKRGNTQALIDRVNKYFDNDNRNQNDWINSKENPNYPIFILDKNKYLEDFLIEYGYLNKN